MWSSWQSASSGRSLAVGCSERGERQGIVRCSPSTQMRAIKGGALRCLVLHNVGLPAWDKRWRSYVTGSGSLQRPARRSEYSSGSIRIRRSALLTASRSVRGSLGISYTCSYCPTSPCFPSITHKSPQQHALPHIAENYFSQTTKKPVIARPSRHLARRQAAVKPPS